MQRQNPAGLRKTAIQQRLLILQFLLDQLQLAAKGNLLRQGAAGRLAKLSVFAKKSHKRAVERSYQGKDYTISMPARPALPVDAQRNLTPTALDAVLRVVQTALGNALMG